jgi:large subunit ribosomal protein L18
MKTQQTKQEKRVRRHKRIRSKVSGTAALPRLSVFRSNQNIYAQLVDDENAVTLASASDIKETTGTKKERAERVGRAIAEKGIKAGIAKVVFDRGGFMYIGRIQALAESARKAGLEF